MITFRKGNLLESDAQALVNTVNTVGVMGKGIALQFKNKYPLNYKKYLEACKSGSFNIGDVLVVLDGDLMNNKLIINFPTKKHWRGNSKYEYIESGLQSLRVALIQHKIKSVAIPPLGCGHGGLEWRKVKELIVNALQNLDIEIQIYMPNAEIKKILQKEGVNKKAKLTPARAMLLYMMYNYESVGETSSLFVANKLAYFLQRRGENLRLNFKGHHYGPYSVQLNHVLVNLNGKYLKGMEQNDAKPFEYLILNYNRFKEVKKYIDSELSNEQRIRLDDVLNLLNGFESTYALELLSTVDFILSKNRNMKLQEIIESVSSWNRRKANLFPKEHIEFAYNHLMQYSQAII